MRALRLRLRLQVRDSGRNGRIKVVVHERRRQYAKARALAAYAWITLCRARVEAAGHPLAHQRHCRCRRRKSLWRARLQANARAFEGRCE